MGRIRTKFAKPPLNSYHARRYFIPFEDNFSYIWFMYGVKIRMVRELRGLSQENVAARLGIAQNTYSKYETNQTRLTVETLERIAEILEVTPMDLMSQQPAIVNFSPNQGTQQSIGHVDTVINNQKELYEQIIQAKDAEIERMQRIIDALLARK